VGGPVHGVGWADKGVRWRPADSSHSHSLCRVMKGQPTQRLIWMGMVLIWPVSSLQFYRASRLRDTLLPYRVGRVSYYVITSGGSEKDICK
jgi:hypothetical protein